MYLIVIFTLKDINVIKGDNINSFMPDEIAFSHDDMIRRYLEKGNCVLLRTGNLLFPYLTK